LFKQITLKLRRVLSPSFDRYEKELTNYSMNFPASYLIKKMECWSTRFTNSEVALDCLEYN
jgi:hypothetical protein